MTLVVRKIDDHRRSGTGAQSDLNVALFAVDYVDWLLRCLRNPSTVASGISKWGNSERSSRSKIVVFLLLSTLIGSTIGSITPLRIHAVELSAVLATLTVTSLLVSLVIHCFCVMFGGKGAAGETIFAAVQMLAVVYVVSNFLAFVVSSAMVLYSTSPHSYGKLPFGSQVLLVSQFLLLVAYIPLSLRAVHGFGYTPPKAATKKSEELRIRVCRFCTALLSESDQTCPHCDSPLIASRAPRGWPNQYDSNKVSSVDVIVLITLGLLSAGFVTFVGLLVTSSHGC